MTTTDTTAPAVRLHTIDEAKALLGGIGHTKFYEEISSGRLGSVRIGRRRFVPDTAIAAYIEELQADSNGMIVEALVDAIDTDGRIDVDAIPAGATLADLEAAKREHARRVSTDAA